jgi:hypothetical protein
MENNRDKNGFVINYHDGIGFVIGWERWGGFGGWNEIYESEPNDVDYYTI